MVEITCIPRTRRFQPTFTWRRRVKVTGSVAEKRRRLKNSSGLSPERVILFNCKDTTTNRSSRVRRGKFFYTLIYMCTPLLLTSVCPMVMSVVVKMYSFYSIKFHIKGLGYTQNNQQKQYNELLEAPLQTDMHEELPLLAIYTWHISSPIRTPWRYGRLPSFNSFTTTPISSFIPRSTVEWKRNMCTHHTPALHHMTIYM